MCLGSATLADAQIYSWRDAQGNLVVSDRRPPGAAPLRTYAVEKASAVRATVFVPAPSSRAYDEIIRIHANLNGVRPDLVRAVVQVESAFNPYARSPKGALGLMQLMPATAQQFGVKNAFDPVENVRAGVAYLRRLLDRYKNNEELALAAYNAGPEAVDRHGQSVPPYRETRNYVEQVNRVSSGPFQTRSRGIYKVTEIVDGHPIARYTDKKPNAGAYAVVPNR
jgi:soluble lytic murein transglycosylase-like protein